MFLDILKCFSSRYLSNIFLICEKFSKETYAKIFEFQELSLGYMHNSASEWNSITKLNKIWEFLHNFSFINYLRT